jgi:hypothetical protein
MNWLHVKVTRDVQPLGIGIAAIGLLGARRLSRLPGGQLAEPL